MLVRDVLKAKGRRVISIGPEATVKAALALFVEHNIGSLPVVKASGQLIGIFSERDVLYGDHHDSERFHRRLIEEVMTPDPLTCSPEETVLEMGRIAPVPRITRLFWAFAGPSLAESASWEPSSIASTTDALGSKPRSAESHAGPQSLALLRCSMTSPPVSAVG
jgi:hypothetical protein